MTTDAWLAIIHHLAVFGIAAVLAAEWTLVRPGLRATDVRRLVRIDSTYGVFAACRPHRRLRSRLPRRQARQLLHDAARRSG